MRINARLDDDAQRQIDYLVQATGQSTSHVVREAIAVYHAQVQGARPRAPSRFLALVGQGRSGRSDVALNVKAHVAQAVEAKFSRAQQPPRRK